MTEVRNFKYVGEEHSAHWPGLTKGQTRELARELCTAILNADCLAALPSDEWLNARLCALGCPEDQLMTWRERIRAMPLVGLADGGV